MRMGVLVLWTSAVGLVRITEPHEIVKYRHKEGGGEGDADVDSIVSLLNL